MIPARVIPEDALRQIPGCESGSVPLKVRELPGGRGCNQVLRVDTTAGSFVWRSRHLPLERPGSLPQVELASQQLAAAAGIAPRVLAAAPDASWLLMEFDAGPVWTEDWLQESASLERLGARLGALHGLPVPDSMIEMDAADIARGQMQCLLESHPDSGHQVRLLVSQVDQLGAVLRDMGGRRALNHGDLQVGNMLGSGPKLVDWEYAQVADPTYDLACLLSYYPALAASSDRLLGSAGLNRRSDRARLAVQIEQFGHLNRLWELVEGIRTG